MRSWVLSLLFFSAVKLHGCLSDPAEPEVQNERSIRLIVNFYNQGEGVTYLYKSLDQALSVPLEDNENPNRRGFIIKETVCLKSENPDLSQCDFKADGDMKICALDLGDEDPENTMFISLTKDVRVRRSMRRPCRRRPCPPWLPGSHSPIGRRPTNQNKPRIICV